MKIYDTPTIQSERRESQVSREETSRADQSREGAGIVEAPKRTLKAIRRIGSLSPAEVERFLSKISPAATSTGCREWIAARSSQGYGQVRLGVAIFKAHRVSYFLATGTDPGALLVCHACDNPKCVNPAHLFLGTNAENQTDRINKLPKRDKSERRIRARKERINTQPLRARTEWTARGSKHGASKLKDDDVIRMRLHIKETGCTISSAAKLFGVSASMASLIFRRKNWAHI